MFLSDYDERDGHVLAQPGEDFFAEDAVQLHPGVLVDEADGLQRGSNRHLRRKQIF